MALILSIETSTQMCSVSLARDGKVIESQSHLDGYSHASHLTILIENVFKGTGCKMSEIDAVAVSSGPGSYTGLRIGISTAKGICYALGKPLIAINSLEIMAWMMQDKYNGNDKTIRFCPMIDARRMEVYTTIFDSQIHSLSAIRAEIINSESFAEDLQHQKIIFGGNGADKCHEVITHENAIFLNDCSPLAQYMATTAEKCFNEGKFEDVAYMEPFYLKDFVATTPKNKVL